MNEVTITLTFTDSEFDRLDRIAAIVGKTRDEVISEMLSPRQMSNHIRVSMEQLERVGAKANLLMQQVRAAGE